MHKINHVDVGQEDKIEINEAHVRYPNYKGTNYDPNFTQNRLKNNSSTNNTPNNYNSNTKSNYESSNQHNSNNLGYGHSKSHQQEKPVNVSVTLHGPVSKDQLYKIQEVLRHPSQYRDRIKPKDRPIKGEYATTFNKFHPKKVEVNEATVKEAIKYGQEGPEVLSRMRLQANLPCVDKKGQQAVTKLFSHLQDAHNHMAEVAKAIVNVSEVSSPEQFTFVLQLAVRPIVQLKIPPHLSAPTELKFERERLTPEELTEENCCNLILP